MTWRCRDDPTNPTYRMSPFARAKRLVGSPICRQKRAWILPDAAAAA